VFHVYIAKNKSIVKIIKSDNIEQIYKNIKNVLDEARSNVFKAINFSMVKAYHEIGRIIVEEEQAGQSRAEYGKYIIRNLSQKLTEDFGKGFDERNLWYMKNFYIIFPKVNALRSELSWTHYRLLLKTEKDDARQFYLIESIENNWSTRQV
jgi:hypothetical protein